MAFLKSPIEKLFVSCAFIFGVLASDVVFNLSLAVIVGLGMQ